MNRLSTIRACDTGTKLVESLMERQDEVLTQLDQLNANIEAMIKELMVQRSIDADHQNASFAPDEAESNQIKRAA